MQIEFASLPYDVQLRLIRARAQELCDADPQFRAMMEIWEAKTHGQFGQYVTTRVVEHKF